MFPASFSSVQFYQKKKDVLLYRASDSSRNYILKSIITKDEAVKQAFYDEYHILSSLCHPSLPVYYGISENWQFSGQTPPALTLCMEDCSAPVPPASFTLSDILSGMELISQVLQYLLEHGVLYTDLNPSNLILSRRRGSIHVTLVDFTFCYYFLHNPHPPYALRFSYDLSPSLKGQQLLIQEMSLLLYELLETHHINSLPSSVWQLLETGRTPSETLLLSDFSRMLSHCAHANTDS